ncbi:MAG: methyltransferase domain-containing protein [Nanoarchaeota archaeon]|nr:methyltransferase domain-containing protein [Nanoarchaeota archaeon]MBU4116734.1 methyltransferase domain-containing protein [Nanoarchaeota archaeon]
MKNKEFFYQQYNKIDWENQEKTKINSFIYHFIIKNIITKKKGSQIKIFDMGFGIGFFFRILARNLCNNFKEIHLGGCEPSKKNYQYFIKKKSLISGKNTKLKTHHKTFQKVKTKEKFDFITAIYVFPHFSPEDLENITKKIYSMLNKKGQFILIVANEKYLEEKLKDKRDLFIKKNIIQFSGKRYREILHYSDIPKIGKIIDYNREDEYYIDLFKKNKFKLKSKKDLNDSDFIATIFVFERKN